MGSQKALIAFNKQIRQLPDELQQRECGLIELGRQHARNFDAGHCPSGGGVQRVLTELRKLADRDRKSAASKIVETVGSELDAIRAKRASRLADTSDRERPAVGDQRRS